ncbi:MAG TPA: cation:proton antiporter [Xanthobacteraceae bacterium]|jgi:Kef-type K+ transport system membrane component KefB/nucleotide-binding universal stress UspA family protein|nr:cation:proton antiporter [Xanthobacteraceae bacterium]
MGVANRETFGADRSPMALRRRTSHLIFILLLVLPGTALAAERTPSPGGSEAIFLAELALLLVVGRLLGEAASRIGQPPVIGQLLGGILLGPSLLGAIFPSTQHLLFSTSGAQKSMVDAVAQLGILMLLLITGMETDLQLVRRVGRAAITVAAAGVALPFICGFALGEFIPAAFLPRPDARLVTAIFLGTALSISSVKIVAMVVREMNFMRRDLGQIIVASAILEDTMGWVIIAVALGLASTGTVDLWSVGRAVIGTALFMFLSFTIGRRIVFTVIRWTNDNFASDFPVITAILVIMIAMALTTELIGVTTVLGAFVAGILIGESPILTRHIDEQLRGLIVALFMPIFFGLAGLSADLTILKNPSLALLAIGLIAIASFGKFLGAFVGGKLGGLTRAESLALGCAMNARGSTEVIVATIGLSAGVINQTLFTLIVTMAVTTTMAMPSMLRWALKRLPLRSKERLRIEREQLDEKSFVTNLERLLLVADESANGKFATQLAGIIAGSGSKPTTVLNLSKDMRKPAAAQVVKARSERSKREIEAAARATTTLEAHPEEEKRGNVDVIARSDSHDAEAVAFEARRGYDLLIVGIEKIRDRRGGFSEEVSLVTKGFEGPVVIVDTAGERAGRWPTAHSKILIPVNGTEASRRAVEVGLTLARANHAQVTTLYVTRAGANGVARRQRRSASRRNELAFLKDIGALADRYEVKARSTTRADVAPDEAILRESERGYDLVVLGANRRTGDTLFFGDTAAAVLDRSQTSKLFVAS